MTGTNLKFTVIQKNWLISKGLQNYTSPQNMSSTVRSTSTHDHYAATSPLSLRSPGGFISAHINKLMIITKRKNHTQDKHKQTERVS